MSPAHRRPLRRARARRLLLAACVCAGVASTPAVARAATPSSSYAPRQILVKYVTATPPRARAAIARAAGAGGLSVTAPHTRLLRLAPGVGVDAALRRRRGRRDVAWAGTH
jgi:hypothetical protein